MIVGHQEYRVLIERRYFCLDSFLMPWEQATISFSLDDLLPTEVIYYVMNHARVSGSEFRKMLGLDQFCWGVLEFHCFRQHHFDCRMSYSRASSGQSHLGGPVAT